MPLTSNPLSKPFLNFTIYDNWLVSIRTEIFLLTEPFDNVCSQLKDGSVSLM